MTNNVRKHHYSHDEIPTHSGGIRRLRSGVLKIWDIQELTTFDQELIVKPLKNTVKAGINHGGKFSTFHDGKFSTFHDGK